MTTYSDLQTIENGARFHSVDLHIHSYGASHDVRDETMTPEAIVDSAVRQGLGVIAITDHNSNANVERAIDHATQNYPGQILVLPGVEVTTSHGHLLAYFAPEATADLSKYLSRLDLVGEMGDENTHTAKSMSDAINEAERLGGICIAAHIDRERTGFDKFAPGFPNWKKDIITSPGLYGLECDAIDALVWYSDEDESDSAGIERKRLLDSRQAVRELSGRHHLAHLQGSDAHSMARFEHQAPTKPWSRMKLAELTFGALRVALVDPTARVRASVSVPPRVPRVRAVVITGGFLNGERIHFSDNLNCLIGGRGTGKSTAIRAVAYAFGLNDEFGDFDSCPDSVTVFCEDEHGIPYRYVRSRGGDIDVKAKEDGAITDVPVDAFRIEYFGQGELAKVAEDPLKNPQLFQEFLDRHISLRDLVEKEETLANSLRENAGRLNPLEQAFGQLKGKRKTLEETNNKLKVAEEGNLREVVSIQRKLAAEKTIRETVESVEAEFKAGFNLSSIHRNFDEIVATAGECTNDAASNEAIAQLRELILANNTAVIQKQQELNALLKQCATQLSVQTAKLKANHQRLGGVVASKLADLKARGIATDIPGLEAMLRLKTSIATEIAGVEQRADERTQCRTEREGLRTELQATRTSMTERRKLQLRGINKNLRVTIRDYNIFLKYEESGIIDEFCEFVRKHMQGTYLQETVTERLCNSITPAELADLVLARNIAKLADTTGISTEWAERIVEKLCYWNILFELQALAKPPKPVINVLTKSTPPKLIPVHQLSDGQRHTILLTIAMLAESNVPLIIDQPEDDLDNAFIFSSIVTTLRSIKERRQVILVTHNANIAVLGDSELILPMFRENDCGKALKRGSIDSQVTKQCVQDILEGGTDAFLRRKEIYHH